jgi:hypothetical protein
MILFGNSHSEYAANAIERVFHDVYDELTIIFVHACSSFTEKMQPFWTKAVSISAYSYSKFRIVGL